MLSKDEMALLDEHRGSSSRAAYLRQLLGQPPLAPVATHAEAVRLLVEQARAGRASAAIALEKALRPHPKLLGSVPETDELERILGGDR